MDSPQLESIRFDRERTSSNEENKSPQKELNNTICLLPTPLHSGRSPSHPPEALLRSPSTVGSASSRHPSTPAKPLPLARSPSPKPFAFGSTSSRSLSTPAEALHLRPEAFPEAPSPPALPPPDAPSLRSKPFTSGPKPLHLRPKPLTASRTPPPPALPPARNPSLKPFTASSASSRRPFSPSKPFTSGLKPLHLRPKPLTAGRTLHLWLHLRPRPYTSARSPPPPASPPPEASSCPEGRNPNFLVAAGWTVLCPREASFLVGHRL
uniref:Uncharacterized protein n=1 Tax=Ananas comosus var. bracteatus TaxID=296719 RepID=A0A6V7QWC7_ANACO